MKHSEWSRKGDPKITVRRVRQKRPQGPLRGASDGREKLAGPASGRAAGLADSFTGSADTNAAHPLPGGEETRDTDLFYGLEMVEPDSEPLPKVTEHGAVEPESGPRTLAKSELSAAAKETLSALGNQVVQLVADFHGWGLVLRAAKAVWAVVKWWQVAEGRRGVDVAKPMTLGAGFDLVLSAHAGPVPSAAEPPVTAAFVPADGPDPGVLVVDGCRVSPGDLLDKKKADKDTKSASHTKERLATKAPVPSVTDKGRVTLIEVDLSELKAAEPDPRNRVVALIEFSRSHLVPELRRRRLWDGLIAEGVECVVYYDQEAEDSVWLFLTEEEKRSSHACIAFDASGRLGVRRL